MTLMSHWNHYFDLKRMALDPHKSDVRKKFLLYNAWVSRAEGVSTHNEGMYTIHNS